jgi:hypothetical protein
MMNDIYRYPVFIPWLFLVTVIPRLYVSETIIIKLSHIITLYE